MPKITPNPMVVDLACPNCGRLPFMYPPIPENEVPPRVADVTCRVCDAELVRDYTPRTPDGWNVTPWRVREGTIAPTDPGDWEERAIRAHEAWRLQEASELSRRVEKIRKEHACPSCGEPACRDANKIKGSWKNSIQIYNCDNCEKPLHRRADPRGPGFGYMGWEY